MVPKGTVKDLTFESKELEEIINMFIYFPANFSSANKYALLIAQDGKDYLQLGRIARFADELIGQKEIENVIIVGIPYKNVKDRKRKYHPHGEQNEAYSRFLAHELVPFIDAEYPTYGTREKRTLIGDSLAATISILTAVKYPKMFGKVILQSPFVNEEVIDAVRNYPNRQLLDVYHVIGKGETTVKTMKGTIEDFLTPNRKLSHVFKEKAFPYFYDEFSGEHTWKYWQPDLKRALKWMG